MGCEDEMGRRMGTQGSRKQEHNHRQRRGESEGRKSCLRRRRSWSSRVPCGWCQVYQQHTFVGTYLYLPYGPYLPHQPYRLYLPCPAARIDHGCDRCIYPIKARIFSNSQHRCHRINGFISLGYKQEPYIPIVKNSRQQLNSIST